MKMLIVRCTKNQKSWNLHCRTRESFPFQPWWSTFDVYQCSLRGSTFRFCLLRNSDTRCAISTYHKYRLHQHCHCRLPVYTETPAFPLPSPCWHWNTGIVATAVSLLTLKHQHCNCRLPVYTETPTFSLLSPCLHWNTLCPMHSVT